MHQIKWVSMRLQLHLLWNCSFSASSSTLHAQLWALTYWQKVKDILLKGDNMIVCNRIANFPTFRTISLSISWKQLTKCFTTHHAHLSSFCHEANPLLLSLLTDYSLAVYNTLLQRLWAKFVRRTSPLSTCTAAIRHGLFRWYNTDDWLELCFQQLLQY